MTAVCCSGRCMGCCGCCGSRRARACRAQCSAVVAVLLVVLGAGYAAARGGTGGLWSGWTLLGAALAAALLDVLGRRAMLALSVPLQVSAALVLGLVPADSAEWRLGRTLTSSACAGLAVGLALPAALLYLAELWQPARRGAACCVPALAAVAGRTLAYSMEAVLTAFDLPDHDSERGAALVGVAPGALALLLMLIAPPPASPYWLAQRGRPVALVHTVTRLRGLRDERSARDEAEDVSDAVREQHVSVFAGNVRGPVLAVLLVGTLPLAGAGFLDALLPVLVQTAPGAEWPDWLVRSAAGVGLLVVVAAVAVLADRAGRRPLVFAACGLLAAGHGTLGYFFFFLGTPSRERAVLAWYITLAGLGAAALGVAALSAVAWLLLAEVLPMRTKAVVPVLALLLDAGLQAVLDALRLGLPWPGRGPDAPAPPDDPKVWPAAWLWAHALWSCLLALIAALLLPETNGFSLAQVHEIFRGPNRRNLQTRL